MICPFMSRPIMHSSDDNGTYHAMGELVAVYCLDDCMARREDGGCKLIDRKE